jgi:hypothetical protein
MDDMAESTLPLAEERLKQTISVLREYIAQASDPMPPPSP